MQSSLNTLLQQNLPRYTSYPPANHFLPGMAKSVLPSLLEAARNADLLSLYIHVPYCDKLCWFCGCHTKHTLSYQPVSDFVTILLLEIAQWGKAIGRGKRISRLHLGGGSPSLLQPAELIKIRQALELEFCIDSTTEISVEMDPSDVKPGTVPSFLSFGMTRASIGVQDFDPLVQRAINRPQSFETTAAVVEEFRSAGLASLNVDALYGLPHQSERRMRETILKVLALSPDRIALFGYAHVPWLKAHQKLINEADLPDGQQRLRLATLSREAILAAGYEAIGIDHFAKPHDALAVATSEGRLRRNFQGYTDDTADVLIGLGPSSIGRFGGGYYQNQPAMGRYAAAIRSGEWAGDRGLLLTQQDRINAWIIEQLMCRYSFSRVELIQKFGETAAPRWNLALTLAKDELADHCEVIDEQFMLNENARVFVRHVASRFDTWLGSTEKTYSKAV